MFDLSTPDQSGNDCTCSFNKLHLIWMIGGPLLCLCCLLCVFCRKKKEPEEQEKREPLMAPEDDAARDTGLTDDFVHV